MHKTQPYNKTEPRDRKLGDKWLDWNGHPKAGESEIDESITIFLALSSAIVCMFIALLPVGWYLLAPRVEQFHPVVSGLIKWSGAGFAVALIVSFFMESILLIKFRKSMFPYAYVKKFILFLLPKTLWLGKKFGISKDRVGNSFLKTQNLVTLSHAKNLSIKRLLILLPRCLRKEYRSQINNRINGTGKTLTVSGGEAARKAIVEYRPSFILAIACERDLMSGIKDIAEKIPVLAVSNKRPEGPCKNTHFSVHELDEALHFIERKQAP